MEQATATPSSAVALAVRGLTRTYGAHVAVDALDLTVHEGDIYGFLGPNGAGKTTAIRSILGLIHRDAGEVRLFGEADLVRARRHVGAIVEIPSFHESATARRNLRWAAAYADLAAGDRAAAIDRVLQRVGLTERADDPVRTYSLGMKQRLGIARALLGRPRLLVLDEPTNGLDPRGMREMRELVKSLALHDQITVFVSSHLLAEVQAMCNRVGILQKGRLRAEGRVDELTGAGGEARTEIDATDREALAAATEQLEGVSVVDTTPDGRLVVAHDGLAPEALNAALHGAGVTLSVLQPRRTSLEDVFLQVTA